jgi:DNA invertase Pin-like site-specific DNA recombinase
MQDAALKNRTKSKRIGNGHRKIQKEQHQDIKKMFSSGMNKSQIARFFGVTPANIRKILNGESHG